MLLCAYARASVCRLPALLSAPAIIRCKQHTQNAPAARVGQELLQVLALDKLHHHCQVQRRQKCLAELDDVRVAAQRQLLVVEQLALHVLGLRGVPACAWGFVLCVLGR